MLDKLNCEKILKYSIFHGIVCGNQSVIHLIIEHIFIECLLCIREKNSQREYRKQ